MSQALIEHCIGDLVAEFIDVPFVDGFRGEEHVFWIHRHSALYLGDRRPSPSRAISLQIILFVVIKYHRDDYLTTFGQSFLGDGWSGNRSDFGVDFRFVTCRNIKVHRYGHQSSNPMTGQTAGGPPGLDIATTLAFERTRVAYERTMMAWVRTATSLITFGFSVYKFFQLEAPATALSRAPIGSREFALALIGIGLLSLLLGSIEHGRDLLSLRKQYPGMPRSMTGLATICIAALGLVALVAVILRD